MDMWPSVRNKIKNGLQITWSKCVSRMWHLGHEESPGAEQTGGGSLEEFYTKGDPCLGDSRSLSVYRRPRWGRIGVFQSMRYFSPVIFTQLPPHWRDSALRLSSLAEVPTLTRDLC